MPSPMAPDILPLMPPIIRHVSPCPYSWNTMSASRSPSRGSGGGLVSRAMAWAGRLAFSASPSLLPMKTDGIAKSACPPIVIKESLTLLTMIAARARALPAFLTLVTKSQPPRSMRAILRRRSCVIASQPSEVVPVPSFTSTTSPVTPVASSFRPNCAGAPG